MSAITPQNTPQTNKKQKGKKYLKIFLISLALAFIVSFNSESISNLFASTLGFSLLFIVVVSTVFDFVYILKYKRTSWRFFTLFGVKMLLSVLILFNTAQYFTSQLCAPTYFAPKYVTNTFTQQCKSGYDTKFYCGKIPWYYKTGCAEEKKPN